MDNPLEVTYIGKTDFRNSMTPFGIKAKDRTKHMYIIGKTGTGKSTFLENMIVQDIRNGNGVAFIDPHGVSAQKLLDFIPHDRIEDVIYLDPADTDFPIAFNPLEDVDVTRRALVVDGLMTVFKKIWPDAFSGRMEYILNNTMLALLEYPNPTLLSINRFLTDKDFRKRVVTNTQDPTVKNAWEELGRWDDKRWSEATGALINKVGQFTTNPLVRNIVGQPQSTFDFRKAMDERKIVIINLSKGRIGEQNQPLFGAMLITKIYLAAMSRADLSASVMDKIPPFYFYVDEFQNFANDSFANILSEARKYKLCLTVANQYINQMEETIRDAVFGNMGTTVAFRVGPLDSELLEKVFTPVFTANDLENLQFGQFYVTLQIDNMGSRPFSAQTIWPIESLDISYRDLVIETSRKNYARMREEVEAEITEWFGYNKKESKPLPVTPTGAEHLPSAVAIQPLEITSPAKTTKYIVADKPKFQPKKSVEKPVAEKVVPLSTKMNDLLGQLEFSSEPASASEPVKVVAPKAPEPEKVITQSQSAPIVPVVKNLDKPIKDRAAKPATKNALLEALEKARKIKEEESVVPEKPKTPTSDLSLKDIINNVEGVEIVLAETKPIEPKPIKIKSEPISIEKQPESESIPIEQSESQVEQTQFQAPKATREVPEEILKKILD